MSHRYLAQSITRIRTKENGIQPVDLQIRIMFIEAVVCTALMAGIGFILAVAL